MLVTAFGHPEEDSGPKAASPPESLSSASKHEGSVPSFKSGRRRRRGRLTTPVPKVTLAFVLTSNGPNIEIISSPCRTIFLTRDSPSVEYLITLQLIFSRLPLRTCPKSNSWKRTL